MGRSDEGGSVRPGVRTRLEEQWSSHIVCLDLLKSRCWCVTGDEGGGEVLSYGGHVIVCKFVSSEVVSYVIYSG